MTITAAKVRAIKNVSILFSLSLRKHIAKRQTNTGVVLFTSEITTTSMYLTAIMLIRLLIVD